LHCILELGKNSQAEPAGWSGQIEDKCVVVMFGDWGFNFKENITTFMAQTQSTERWAISLPNQQRQVAKAGPIRICILAWTGQEEGG